MAYFSIHNFVYCVIVGKCAVACRVNCIELVLLFKVAIKFKTTKSMPRLIIICRPLFSLSSVSKEILLDSNSASSEVCGFQVLFA